PLPTAGRTTVGQGGGSVGHARITSRSQFTPPTCDPHARVPRRPAPPRGLPDGPPGGRPRAEAAGTVRVNAWWLGAGTLEASLRRPTTSWSLAHHGSAIMRLMRLSAAMRARIAPFRVMDVMEAAAGVEAMGHPVLHLEVGQRGTRAPSTVLDAAHRAL